MSDERLRVLHVASWYPSPANELSGGFVREHVRASARHADVAVVHLLARQAHLGFGYELEDLEPDDLGGPVLQVRHGRSLPGLVGAVRGLTRAHRSLTSGAPPFSLVHAHVAEAAVPAALLARRLGVPLVITEHWTVYLPADPAALSRGQTRLVRWALETADRVLPVSTGLASAIASVAPRARLDVVPNVVDVDRFAPSPPPSGPPVIVAVGLLSPQKGFADLVEHMPEVIRRLPGASLVIVGEGAERAALERLVERLGLRGSVTLVGAASRAEVAELLRRSTLLCAPSRFETFSVVCAEALAAGRPVVATRSGGPEGFIGADQGALVDVGDGAALVDAIVQVAGRAWEASDLHRHAAERFALPVVAEQLAATYQHVIQEHR